MRSQQIGLGITLVVLAASSAGLLVTGGPGAAWPPALGAVIGGVLLYRLVKHPQPPTRWTKQRVIVSALAIGLTTAAIHASDPDRVMRHRLPMLVGSGK